MGKTRKDKINYARFHKKQEILTPEERRLGEVMDLHGAGNRYGNKRKFKAHEKVTLRRAERKRAK